jgi:hypothetical protein
MAALGLLLATGGAAAASDETPPIVFADTEPVTLGTDPIAVTVLNNDPTATYYLLSAAASVRAADTAGAPDETVGVSYQTGSSTTIFDPQNPPDIGPASALRLVLAGLSTADKSSGWLTITAGTAKGRPTEVVRLQLQTAAPTPPKAPSTWTLTSPVWWSRNQPATTQIPLTSGSCADAGTVKTLLVNQDHTAAVTSTTCSGDSSLPFTISGAGIGSYVGTAKVGDGEVTITLVRTLWVIWPIVAILVGLICALIATGVGERTWLGDQRRWIKRLKSDARAADNTFATNAKGQNWAAFRITDAVDTHAADLEARRAAIRNARGGWVKQNVWPWPAGFRQTDRDSLLTDIKLADKAISGWALVGKGIADLQNPGVDLDVAAPELKIQADALHGGRNGPDTFARLGEIEDFVTYWPQAMAAIAALSAQKARLDEIDAGKSGLGERDTAVLADVHRVHQTLTVLVRESKDTKVVADLTPRIGSLGEDIAGLPIYRTETIDEETTPENVTPETASATANLSGVSAVIGRALAGVGGSFLTAATLVVTVAVAITTGLAALYNGKAWGSPTDLIAAFAWGFTTAAILTPVLGAFQRWGSRVADQPDPKKA